MNKELQRIAIAKYCNWYEDNGSTGRWAAPANRYRTSQGYWCSPVDILEELNAMHEAEKLLLNTKASHGGDAANVYFGYYLPYVCKCVEGDDDPNSKWYEYGHIGATAAQRAEAFLRTLNLWTDE